MRNVRKKISHKKNHLQMSEAVENWTLWDTHRCQLDGWMWYILFLLCSLFFVRLRLLVRFHRTITGSFLFIFFFLLHFVVDERWNRPSQPSERDLKTSAIHHTNQRPPSKQNEMLSRVKTNRMGPVKIWRSRTFPKYIIFLRTDSRRERRKIKVRGIKVSFRYSDKVNKF